MIGILNILSTAEGIEAHSHYVNMRYFVHASVILVLGLALTRPPFGLTGLHPPSSMIHSAPLREIICFLGNEKPATQGTRRMLHFI